MNRTLAKHKTIITIALFAAYLVVKEQPWWPAALTIPEQMATEMYQIFWLTVIFFFKVGLNRVETKVDEKGAITWNSENIEIRRLRHLRNASGKTRE